MSEAPLEEKTLHESKETPKIHLPIVAYLPPEVSEEVKRIRDILEEKFGISAAKKWEPHLTVGNGLDIPDDKLASAVRDFKQFTKSLNRIKIIVEGVDYLTDFDTTTLAKNPYVIFLKVAPSEELQKLFENIEAYGKSRRKESIVKEFKPHITLAYDDLDKSKFEATREFLQKIGYNPRFEFFLDNVSLVTHDDDKDKWVLLKQFPLKSGNQT